MTLVADRFIRLDDGVVRDLVTGEEVALIELRLTGAAEQIARRDYCLARLEAQACRGGENVSRDGAEAGWGGTDVDPPGPSLEDFALVDFGLIGESRWIEAYRRTSAAATPHDGDGVPARAGLTMAAATAKSSGRGTAPGRGIGTGTRTGMRMRASTLPDEAVWPRGAAWLDGAWPRGGGSPLWDGPVPSEGGVGAALMVAPVVDAIAATLDGLGAHEMPRLFVKAPQGARLDGFEAIIAREVRARGFIPMSASVLGDSPAIARVVASRSIVLFADARCAFNNASASSFGIREAIARAVALLHRAASMVAALVAHVCDHVNVAALRLMPAISAISTSSTSRSAFGWRHAAGPGAVSVSDAGISIRVSSDAGSLMPSSEQASGSALPPQSVVRPVVEISYDDPNLPSLFPHTGRIAHVAETATRAAFDVDEWQDVVAAGDTDGSADTSGPEVANERGERATDVEAGAVRGAERWAAMTESYAARTNGAGPHVPILEDASTFESPPALASAGASASDEETRYPPLRLVRRRTRPESSEPVAEHGTGYEREAGDIPVVTTMVSGYGEAVDALVGRGRWAAASRALRAELAAYERRKRGRDAARTSIALGRLHLAMGEVGAATRCFDRAGELACAGGQASGTGTGAGSRPNSDSDADLKSESNSGSGDSRAGHGNARLIGEALRWSGIAALDAADLDRGERLLRSALAAIGPEADPYQAFAIELSLARCLFWQGRVREVVLPSPRALSPRADGIRDLRLDGDPSDRAALGGSPPDAVVAGHAAFAALAGLNAGVGIGVGVGVERDALASVILRVEHCRRAARLALVDGDLSAASDAIARACRLARGADEDDVRDGGCRFESSKRDGKLRRHDGAATDVRIREALRAACHLEAARLQFAIGDTASGDAHLRESLALSRASARTVRVQLLQLARFRNVRTTEARRRFERLSAALRQPQMPRLVRIQARYLIDPRSRRARELVTFLDRHGDTALAGYGHSNRRGGSPMLEAFQDVLRICHETPDDLTALTSVSAWLREQLRALSVAIYGMAPASTAAAASRPSPASGDAHAPASQRPSSAKDPGSGESGRSLPAGATPVSNDVVHRKTRQTSPSARRSTGVSVGSGESGSVIEAAVDAEQNEIGGPASSDNGTVVVRYAVAGSTRVLSPILAMRAIGSGLAIPPTYRPDALDAAAPVRYAGATIGAVVVRWSIDAVLDHTNASALLGAAAAAISPHLRAALDRDGVDADLAASRSGSVAASGRGSGAANVCVTGSVTGSATASGGGSGARAAPSVSSATGTALRSRSQARTLGLLGISASMDTLRHTITRVSSAPFHVLIEGESGSGKELVARALHQHGPRRHRRFCAVNCAALTDELLEAELFGHTRGAFTGALIERAGLFEEADGGTLFLDEIGELSPRGQAKLLRVIQDGETRRIGENLPRRVDTRIIAATNRSLRDEAEAGQFRADLLYRLDVIRITVPPLRARPEDVPVLARAFWEEATARLRSRATLDPATLVALARYHWPGNVRELHNAIMALAVHAPPRGRVTPSQLPETIGSAAAAPPVHTDVGAPTNAAADGKLDAAVEEHENCSDDADGRAGGGATDDPSCRARLGAEVDRARGDARDVTKAGSSEREPLPGEGRLEDARRAFESRHIRAALARAGGSPSRAAHALGLTRQGLKKLMARLELDNAGERRARLKRTTARKERSPP